MSGPASTGDAAVPVEPTIDAATTATTLHVRPFRPGQAPPPPGPAPDLTGGAVPSLWLGAEPVGGLTLPAAMPTASQLYAPRAVWLDDDHLIAADTGNHRLLIWRGPMEDRSSHQAADVVLGQADFSTEGAQAGGRGPERGMRLPTGVIVVDGRLVVADAWNHRILIWDQVPTRSDVAPDVILGQATPTEVDENRGGACGPLTFYWPFGLAMVGTTFYVADTGNRRVLAWSDGLPEPDQAPDLVLGQPSADVREENRGQLGPDSFRWPHDIAGIAGGAGNHGRAGDQREAGAESATGSELMIIADAGNHRLLGWQPQPTGDRPADLVLGQPDFTTGSEFPYAPQTATGLRFPYAIDITTDVATDRGLMAVADTANNRILLWDGVPRTSGVPASRVLAQPTFAANGENRWDTVAADTLCWPYGLSLHGGRLAVADSGNNRIVVWDL